ncbi:hypothetical protein BHM03_00029428, partial [Ensete ventricosum]
PPLARPLSARGHHDCDQPFVADPRATAVGCGCRLRASDPMSAWAVDSVVDATDLYAHSEQSNRSQPSESRIHGGREGDGNHWRGKLAVAGEAVKESGKREGEGTDLDGGVVAVVGEAAGAEGAIGAVETVTRSWGNLRGGCSGRTSSSAATAATAANDCHPLVLQ